MDITVLIGESGRVFFILFTILVTGIVWFGYYKNIFSPWFTWLVVLVLFFYSIAFLWSRYITGHMEADMATSTAVDVAFVAFHGMVSLVAIVQSCIMFIFAERSFSRGQNYFVSHRRLSILLVVVWLLSLLSGLFL